MNQAKSFWEEDFYRIKKKVLAIGTKYYIENRAGQTVGFTTKAPLKLKEDISIWTSEEKEHKLLTIKQSNMNDVWGTFVIVDPVTGNSPGAFKRDAWKSGFTADTWDLLDPAGNVIGCLRESTGKGILRKIVSAVPAKMRLQVNGQEVAEVNQVFQMIGDCWEVECGTYPPHLDRRILVAGIILMGMIEAAIDERRD